MALGIKYDEETKYGRTPQGRWCEWHVGDPIPYSLIGRVVTFQADGHELEMILLAMKNSRVNGRSKVVMKDPIFECPEENT